MRAVIVDCAIYRDGRRTDGPADFSDALDEARATGDAFLWIGLHEPTEKEFDLVSSEFGLHPLAVEDALSAHQRPKLEVYDDSLFVVIKPVVYEPEGDTVTTDELMLFIGDSFVVTVRHGESAPLADGTPPAGGRTGGAQARADRGAVRGQRRRRRPLHRRGGRAPGRPGGAGGRGVRTERQRGHQEHRIAHLHLQAAGAGVPPGHRPAERADGPAGGRQRAVRRRALAAVLPGRGRPSDPRQRACGGAGPAALGHPGRTSGADGACGRTTTCGRSRPGRPWLPFRPWWRGSTA